MRDAPFYLLIGSDDDARRKLLERMRVPGTLLVLVAEGPEPLEERAATALAAALASAGESQRDSNALIGSPPAPAAARALGPLPYLKAAGKLAESSRVRIVLGVAGNAATASALVELSWRVGRGYFIALGVVKSEWEVERILLTPSELECIEKGAPPRPTGWFKRPE